MIASMIDIVSRGLLTRYFSVPPRGLAGNGGTDKGAAGCPAVRRQGSGVNTVAAAVIVVDTGGDGAAVERHLWLVGKAAAVRIRVNRIENVAVADARPNRPRIVFIDHCPSSSDPAPGQRLRTACRSGRIDGVRRITAAVLAGVAGAFHIAVRGRSISAVTIAAETAFAVLHTGEFEAPCLAGCDAPRRRILRTSFQKTVEIEHARVLVTADKSGRTA